MYKKLICASFLALAVNVAIADEEFSFSSEVIAEAELASFDDGIFDSLSDYDGDPDAAAILVNCRVWSRATTLPSLARCFLADPSHRDRFISDVERIADRAKLNSAVVDGNLERTEIYFRVLLTRDAGGSQIHYFENWGHDAERYGYDYRAPQRLTPLERTGERASCGGSRIISLVTVGVDGRARDDIKFETVKGKPSDECYVYIRNLLLTSDFIPARHNGKAVEALHMQMLER
jgi:hypothetical protein